MRLDKLLFALRLAKSRTLAQRWIAEGHMRRNRARVLRIDQPVCPGDTLTLPMHGPRGGHVLVIEILSLPLRRGPASEARTHYRMKGGAEGEAGGPALTGADHSP